MKKTIFVLICLLIATVCWALESAPSNEVGFYKINAVAGGYTAFGLPFVFWDVPTGNVPTYGTESRKPSDIVGSQANPGTFLSADRVIRQDNGNFAYRTPVTAPVWTGSLETPGPLGAMEPARAYWYLNKTASARPIILAGQVDTSAGANLGLPDPIPTVTVTANGYTPISWRDSRVILRSKLGLVAQGFVGGTF
ncbi:hypothetical protein KJ815_06355, partial [bacterium]|nr:hypothetical protein [bacterium]